MTDDTFISQVSILMQNEDYPAVIRLAQTYLPQVPPDSDSANLAMLIEADAERLSGKIQQAWDRLQRIDPNVYPGPWTRVGMDILYDLGRKKEAYEFCAQNIPRIPQPNLRQGVREMCVARSIE